MCPDKVLPDAEVCMTCVFCNFLGTSAIDGDLGQVLTHNLQEKANYAR